MTTMKQAVRNYTAARRVIADFLREEGLDWLEAENAAIAILTRLAKQDPPILLSREGE